MGVVEVLKPHNLEAYQEINGLLKSGVKKIAIPRATGSGKTYVVGALAEQFNDEKKLVLEPTRPLLNSIEEKFKEFGIANTDFITYQKLIRMSDEDIAAMDYKLIFLDEFHHGTAPVWGMKIDCLMKTHSDSIIFGISATTVRNDGVNVVETLFDNNAIGELSLSTAIARKVLPCPHYITAIYRIDDEFEKLKKRVEDSTNSKDEKKEFYHKMQEMKVHFEKSYGIPLILNKYIKIRNGKYLVFCKNKKHLNAMRDVVINWFETAGIKDIHSYAVYSDYPEKETDYKKFREDNSDSLKLLFSINMLNEGLHIEDVSGVLMLRTTRSNLIYLQQLGRLLEAGNMDKYLLVFDFVNNFSSANDGVGLLKEIKDAIAKEKESDPDFDDSGFEDIDTYFVLDQILEVQEMFREIEGRLQGNWDVMFQEYCKFYEENGHGDVPKTEEYRKLNNWCKYQRQDLGNGILEEERKQLLNNNGFIWDIPKYRFEKQIIETKDFILKNGRYPKTGSENKSESNLGYFVSAERTKKRQVEKEENVYPEWKLQIIDNIIPNFCWNPLEESFDIFLRFLTEYIKETDRNYVEKNVVFKGYDLGKQFSILKNSYNKGSLPDYKKNALLKLGVTFEDLKDVRYRNNWELLEECVNEGKVLNSCNRKYKNVDLYSWIKGTVKKHIEESEQISESQRELIHHALLWRRKVKVLDLDSKQIYVYSSANKASQALCNNFRIAKNAKSVVVTINNHLSGKTTTPYKGRFMFYYATDEEVKKCFEDNKTN